MPTSDKKSHLHPEPIAIIGIAGRFPGAENVGQFWQNILEKKEGIRFFSNEELRAEGISQTQLDDPQFIKAKGHLENAEMFDAAFFKFTPLEANVTDPQYRVFLESAWEALESAGYADLQTNKKIGVFATSSSKSNYYEQRVLRNQEIQNTASDYQLLIGHAKDFLATLVAYKLNCTGPAINVHTACSSSLTAICLAAQSIQNGDCDMAIAGGVSVKYPLRNGYLYQEGMIYSPNGECHAFDENAQGMVSGDGVGVVVLKPLSAALRDRDHIHAVIKGFAMNNDGINKLGFTAPSVLQQTEVIKSTYNKAQITPDKIGYIECHGTATILGDSVEISALKAAYETSTKNQAKCFIGSVKSNIGHLDVASGIVGMIKAALALEHQTIPPNIHFEKPNPLLENSHFCVPTTASQWEAATHPRYAAVSSFGIGGTNVHLVLEESPAEYMLQKHREWQLIVLSAKSPYALAEYTNKFAMFLEKNSHANMANVSYSTQVARKAFPYRYSLICQQADDAKKQLYLPIQDLSQTIETPSTPLQTVFMFPGYGVAYKKNHHCLYQTEPMFRSHLNACLDVLERLTGYTKAALLNPEDSISTQLPLTISHPLLFAFEYALAMLWIEWGITPDIMIGHSQGEYVAACLAGVFSLEDALTVVYKRAALIEKSQSGAMLAILASTDIVTSLLPDHPEVVIATINAPQQCVVSGNTQAIQNFQATLNTQNIVNKVISDRFAFHSPLLQNITAEYLQVLSGISLNAPKIAVISNVTAKTLTPQQAQNPHYWVEHLLSCVQFQSSIESLLEENSYNFIEIGPGHNISSMVRQILSQQEQPVSNVITSLHLTPEAQDESAALLKAIGCAWQNGLEIDWHKMHQEERLYRTPLPTYPFEREHFALTPDKEAASAPKNNVENFLLVPRWNSMPLPVYNLAQDKDVRIIFFMETNTLSEKIAQCIAASHPNLIYVTPDKKFQKLSNQSYTINPENKSDYISLFSEFNAESHTLNIIYAWTLAQKSFDDVKKYYNCYYFNLLCIAQSLAETFSHLPIKIAVLNQGLYAAQPQDCTFPAAALVLGPLKVIPQEFSNLSCMSLDFSVELATTTETQIRQQVLQALQSNAAFTSAAYRGTERYVPQYEPVSTQDPSPPICLRKEGVYLITGGLSGIGLALAGFLAEKYSAHLILLSRTPLPAKTLWKEYLENHSANPLSSVLRELQRIEKFAKSVTIFSQDVADYDGMQRIVTNVENTIGEIHGVIHSAGIASGATIQNTSLTNEPEVFKAKIHGTLTLDKLFSHKKLDFMLLNSALTGITGALGQVDYTAANAFLDAYAQYANKCLPYPVISINWDIWQETGMAANLVQMQNRISALNEKLTMHPIFSKVVFSKGYIFYADLQKPWVELIQEHRLDDQTLAPATMMIEAVRAAFACIENFEVICMEDLHIVAPLFVTPHTQCRVILTPIGNKFSFSVESMQTSKQAWDQNAYGYVSKSNMDTLNLIEANKIFSDNDKIKWNSEQTERKRSTRFVLGERWNCLKETYIQTNLAYGKLRLDEKNIPDLDQFAFCPPLLDVALNFWQRAQDQQFLPFYCESLLLKNKLSPELFAYAQLNLLNHSTLSSDSYLFDKNGMLLGTAKQWILRKISDEISAPSTKTENFPSRLNPLPSFSASLGERVSTGITTFEGLQSFARILQLGVTSVAVAKSNLKERLKQISEAKNLQTDSNLAPTTPGSQDALSLPDTISEIWANILGYPKVNNDMDFFDLGGNSLLAIQVSQQLWARAKIKIAPHLLLAHSTVNKLSSFIQNSKLTKA